MQRSFFSITSISFKTVSKSKGNSIANEYKNLYQRYEWEETLKMTIIFMEIYMESISDSFN